MAAYSQTAASENADAPEIDACRASGLIALKERSPKFFALLDVFFSIKASPSTIALIFTSPILEFIFMTRTLDLHRGRKGQGYCWLSSATHSGNRWSGVVEVRYKGESYAAS